MLNAHDIEDWEMLTIPLTLNKLKKGDVFTALNDPQIMKHSTVIKDMVLAEVFNFNNEVCRHAMLPNYMKVNLWVQKKSESLKNTEN